VREPPRVGVGQPRRRVRVVLGAREVFVLLGERTATVPRRTTAGSPDSTSIQLRRAHSRSSSAVTSPSCHSTFPRCGSPWTIPRFDASNAPQAPRAYASASSIIPASMCSMARTRRAAARTDPAAARAGPEGRGRRANPGRRSRERRQARPDLSHRPPALARRQARPHLAEIRSRHPPRHSHSMPRRCRKPAPRDSAPLPGSPPPPAPRAPTDPDLPAGSPAARSRRRSRPRCVARRPTDGPIRDRAPPPPAPAAPSLGLLAHASAVASAFPRQRRAGDAGREGFHPAEHRERLARGARRPPGTPRTAAQRHRLGRRQAGHGLGHERPGGARQGAPARLEPRRGDAPVAHDQPQGDAIPAQGLSRWPRGSRRAGTVVSRDRLCSRITVW